MELIAEVGAALPVSQLTGHVPYYLLPCIKQSEGSYTIHELWRIDAIVFFLCETIGHQSDIYESPAEYVRYEDCLNSGQQPSLEPLATILGQKNGFESQP